MIRTYRGAWVPDSITLFTDFMKSLIYAKLGAGNLISYLFTNESASDIRFEQKLIYFLFKFDRLKSSLHFHMARFLSSYSLFFLNQLTGWKWREKYEISYSVRLINWIFDLFRHIKSTGKNNEIISIKLNGLKYFGIWILHHVDLNIWIVNFCNGNIMACI